MAKPYYPAAFVTVLHQLPGGRAPRARAIGLTCTMIRSPVAVLQAEARATSGRRRSESKCLIDDIVRMALYEHIVAKGGCL